MTYDELREQYKPRRIKYLLIAESQPPSADITSSRHFYRTDQIRKEDRLFTNTIRALYPETANIPEPDLEKNKVSWLHRLQADGWYMIESLETSLQHEVTKLERQALIQKHLPELITHVKQLANKDTKLILIKSNVFVVATQPLRDAGFTVLNQELVDYPGRFNQRAYREKLAKLVGQ
jgi:hypothetical protein